MTFCKYDITIGLSLLLIILTGCGGGGGSSPAAAPPSVTGSVNGTITVAAGSFVDSDVNDPAAPYAPNDDSFQAQVLRNPFIVGGFVSTEDYDSRKKGYDYGDYYNVELAQGQVLTLSISDHSAVNDLDLYLKNPATGDTLAFSEGTTSLETITVPAAAIYDVVVKAFSGTSKYVLMVSAAGSELPPPALDIGDDFVPGEIVVRFKNTDLGISSQKSLLSSAEALGISSVAVPHDRPLLVEMKDDGRRQSILNALGVRPNRQGAAALNPIDEEKLVKQDTLDAIRALRRRPDIISADPNYIRRPTSFPNDQYYAAQWNYPLINLPQAWDIAADTSGVRVAVVDTGVYMAHPDLAANLLADGYDFISDPARALDGDGIDPDPDDPGDSPTPGLSSFHGTHVTGIIAAMSNNSTGVTGVSWDGNAETCRILPVRVLGLGGGTSYDVIQGVRYAAGLSNDSGIILDETQRADIINLSLAGGGFSQTEQNTFTEVRNKGVVCIAASGNENTNVPSYPASYDNVVSVSAVDLNKEKTWYSNYGPTIDVAAPGGDNRFDKNGDGYADGVLSTLVDDSSGSRQPVYAFYNGTSMAAPHVAGVVALMKGINPGLSPNDFDILLMSGTITQDLGTSGRDDTFGYGMIDAFKALQASGAPLPAVLVISPSALHFGATLPELTLAATNGGASPLQITGVTETAPWLEVAPEKVDADGLGTYRATVDRTGLNDANYAATISFATDTTGTIEVPVTMQVYSNGASDYNAGFQYILLVDPDTNNTMYVLNAASAGGIYRFSFTNISPGDYYVVAGTDSDNDGYICGPGEACGGYPTLDQLAPVTVDNDNITGIDFTTGFSVNFSSVTSTAPHIPAAGFAIEAKRKSRAGAD
jgi:serine protease